MSNSAYARLESRLADEFGYGHAVLFGRARSALAALLDVLVPHAGFDILIPSNVCPALLAVTWAAAGNVRLLPVDPSKGLVSDAVLASAIRQGNPGIAVATQLYGYRQSHPLTQAAARECGWFLLENDTLLTGARSVIGRVSPFADAVLLSFSYAKTIEVGGGGALLTNDPLLAGELQRQALRYRPLTLEAQQAEIEETHLRRKLRRKEKGSDTSAEALLLSGMPYLRFGFPDHLAEPLSAALDCLSDIAGRRRARAEVWTRALAGFGEQLQAPSSEAALPWRVIRRMPHNRNRVVLALREAGFDAGTNYPSLADEHPNLLRSFKHADAAAWGEQVINLWVSDDYDDDRIQMATAVIGSALEQCRAS